jgi:hypothetical protein
VILLGKIYLLKISQDISLGVIIFTLLVDSFRFKLWDKIFQIIKVANDIILIKMNRRFPTLFVY